MNILAISTRVPKVDGKGDQVLSYNRLVHLREKGHNILLICFANTNYHDDLISINKLQNSGIRIEVIRWSLAEAMYRISRFFIDPAPLQCLLFTSRKFNKKVEDAYRDFRPDIIYSILIRPLCNLGKINKPIVVEMIDSMGLNLERKVAASGYLKSIVHSFELKRVKKYEKNLSNNKAVLPIVVSEIDREYIGSSNITVLPLGVNTDYFCKTMKRHDSRKIIFSGNMSYAPNESAAIWFLENVWEYLLDYDPSLTFYIVGSNPSKKLLKFQKHSKSVVVTGRVGSIVEFLHQATISVAPMLTGSGMQFKILEAMSCGLPVVTSNIGAGDIRAKNGVEILISPLDGLAYSKVIIQLLKDAKLSKTIGDNAREYVVKYHSWHRINEKFERILLNAVT